MIPVYELVAATCQTLYIILVSGALSSLLGLILGALLFAWEQPTLMPHRTAFRVGTFILNAIRAIPFLILMIALIPLTRWLIGTAIGIHAATISLTIGALPLMVHAVYTALKTLSDERLLQAQALGARPWQTLCHMLLPEALPTAVRSITLMWISLIGYASMAGALDGGGLGDFAIRYGYQRFNTEVMCITVLLIYTIVQITQSAGFAWARYLAKPKSNR